MFLIINTYYRAVCCHCRGLTGNFVLFLYYAAPLSTVVAVFKQKSSASIYWPYCLMNCINAGLWMAYGVVRLRFRAC